MSGAARIHDCFVLGGGAYIRGGYVRCFCLYCVTSIDGSTTASTWYRVPSFSTLGTLRTFGALVHSALSTATFDVGVTSHHVGEGCVGLVSFCRTGTCAACVRTVCTQSMTPAVVRWSSRAFGAWRSSIGIAWRSTVVGRECLECRWFAFRVLG